MNNCVLTMCLPAYRMDLWKEFYNSVKNSCQDVPFEIIYITPHYDIPSEMRNIDNVRFIHDFGSFSRCVQIASCIASGKLISWPADDAIYFEGALKKSIEFLLKQPRSHAMVGKYCEGAGFRKNPQFQYHPDAYWYPKYHWANYPFPTGYKMSGAGLMYTDYFKQIGGLDCSYINLGVCCHDLFFRLQNSGGVVHIDEVYQFSCDHDAAPSLYRDPISEAYARDFVKFADTYSSVFPYNRITINFDNWKESPTRWLRFK